jgi:hypothetical protein
VGKAEATSAGEAGGRLCAEDTERTAQHERQTDQRETRDPDRAETRHENVYSRGCGHFAQASAPQVSRARDGMSVFTFVDLSHK